MSADPTMQIDVAAAVAEAAQVAVVGSAVIVAAVPLLMAGAAAVAIAARVIWLGEAPRAALARHADALVLFAALACVGAAAWWLS